MKRTPRRELMALVEAASEREAASRGTYSRLYQFLWDNWSVLGQLPARPNWSRMAERLPDEVLDGTGKRPSGDVLRNTHYRVGKAKALVEAGD